MRRDPSVGGNLILREVISGVAEEPATNVNRLIGRVVQLDHVSWRRVLMGQHFVDDHRSGRDEYIIVTWRSARRRTAAPSIGSVPKWQRRMWIADRQREPRAIGLGIPIVLIVKQVNVATDRRVEFECLAGIVQASCIDPGDDARIDRPVAIQKCGLVPYDHAILARADRNGVGECEGDPVAETQSSQLQRLRTDVPDLEKFKIIVVGISGSHLGSGGCRRIEHDLGDADRRCQIDVIRRLIHRAPRAVHVSARLDVRVRVQREGPLIN